MADVDSNYTALKGAAETWKEGNQYLQAQVADVLSGDPFKALHSSPDLTGNFIPEINQSVAEMLAYGLKKQQKLEEYAATLEQIETEDPGDEKPPTDTQPPGNTTPPGTNPPGSTSPPVTTPPGGDTTPPEVEPPGDEVEDPPLAAMDIDTSCLRDLPLKDIDGVVDTILSIAQSEKKYIDEILDSDDYSDKIKEELLKSDFIPDSLKEQLLDADSIICRKLFQAIMKGEFPEIFELNPLNIGAAYKYLERIASELGISVEELLLDDKYTETLRGALKNFDGVIDFCKSIDDLDANTYQDRLLEVWDGNVENMQDSTIDIVRDFISYVAEQVSDETQEVTPEELLSNRDYAEVLKEATQQFAKSCVFLNAGGYMSDNGVHETIGGLFTGKNAKAMGMDSETQKNFKAEVDALAKEKGTTTEALLNDNKYADDVKNLLNSSKNAKEIGPIYAKQDSAVSQKVVNNLYQNEITNDTSIYSFVPETGAGLTGDVDVPTGDATPTTA